MRVAAYVRATPADRGWERDVLDKQRSEVEARVAERGWELDAVYEEVPAAEDPFARPALLSMLDGLAKLDKVVIPSLRVLKPSAAEALDIVRRLRRAGVDLVSLEEDFDTGAPGGAAVPRVLAFAAAYDKERTSSQGWHPENLRKPGLDPATVVDVGVATGTPALYNAFPQAHLVLIEPLVEYLPSLERFQAERGAEYVVTAVGAEPGHARIDVDRGGAIFSSMLPRVPAPPAERLEAREVPVTTLDNLLEERAWRAPFGLKLDVEGFEHEVIAGARRLLRDTQFVIAEVSLSKRFESSHTFAEFVALMDSHGFRMCEVLDMPKVAAFGEPRYANAMFRRDDRAA
jgi:FkbM family methyltransferase